MIKLIKKYFLRQTNRIRFGLLILFVFAYPSVNLAQSAKSSGPNVISYVDHSLNDSQKYTLIVGNKPFYMTSVQVRMDLLRYSEKWSSKARQALISRAAADGFNTVSFPLHWYEVEPEKDKFDWTILDEYLSLINKNNMKMELLWFGTNSGSHVQWLSRAKTNPNHLRTPDYVLYSPEPGSKQTTSDYRIRRDMSDYSVDLADKKLRDRETYVLGRVMEHISQWDRANDSKHPVIGVQIGNEVLGFGLPYSNSLVISYLSDVASAVKNSNYVVWTRINCVFSDIPTRIYENETKRDSSKGTNIDFVGIDTYRHHFASDAKFVESMRSNVPYVGKNYRMIMETNADVVYPAQMHLAALSGNNAFSLYSIESLYGKDGDKVKPLVNYLDDIRLVNRIINNNMVDIAKNVQGNALYVHNWQGVNSSPTTSNAGITYIPDYPTSQGISILRSPSEIVLSSTKGGRFELPDSLRIISASRGYFNRENEWVDQGKFTFGKFHGFDSQIGKEVSVILEAGSTVRIIREEKSEIPHKSYQAEFAALGGGATYASDIDNIGFSGNGYVPFKFSGGYYIIWQGVEGQKGGKTTIKIRYSYAGNRLARCVLTINGTEQLIRLKPTTSSENYELIMAEVSLNPGSKNIIKLESVNNSYRVNRMVNYQGEINVDELQVF